jgi:hypothetical protein
MAVSVARVGELPYRITGTQKETVTDVTFDTSYPTGGEAITAADLGLNAVSTGSVKCEVKAVGGTVNVANVIYDDTNKKLIVYDETPAEVADTSTLATLVVRVTARGY